MPTPNQPEILDWSAKRSGLYLTVTGKDHEGQARKVVGVTEIRNGTAFCQDGSAHRLANPREA